ncbi:putative baseplate assembly protein [Sphingomonas sp. 28-63-12]|uniref:putative baseplate assembly protein n=1 Tax=Sphingomonas sp. 28-63-12 TaxID=1970434 RepID=UPI000BD13D0A|nr:MAG: putative baseplate assembly protein [Sphingomonas sp. 28-63-12]
MSNLAIPGAITCGVDQRRQRLFNNPDWNGLDYLDIAEDQLSLCLHFFGAVPEGLTPDNFGITGGRRICDIQVIDVAIDPSHDEEIDDCLRLTLNRRGDFSTYTLCLVDLPGIDPRFCCLDFSFKINCPSDLDCGASLPCPPMAQPSPDLNYLAKDYAAFQQLIYDRLALTLPDWRERHATDIGMMLVDLLAYAGDYLSYYQDAVATEAYLDTARQRISVRRHLRLIDYAMHEGCNARAFVTVATDSDFTIDRESDFFFITGADAVETDAGGFARLEALAAAPATDYAVFEPIGITGPVTFHAAHSRIALHDWGDSDCCLPRGATSATLVDHGDESDAAAPPHLSLQPGDYLIFEEVLGPLTGNPADADPDHRQVVRLTSVQPGHDALLNMATLDITWSVEDALRFPLCISSHRPTPDCDPVRDVSIARGNVIPVDHGQSLNQQLKPVEGIDLPGECACDAAVIEISRRALRYDVALDHAPITYAVPVAAGASAAALGAQDPRLAVPAVALADGRWEWQARRDLIGSDDDDRHFVVEIDDEGVAHLRFGDGMHGRSPDVGAAPIARYRTGSGSTGNVGRDAITRLVLRSGTIDGPMITVRNPLAASGGSDPEPVAEARLIAPGMIKAQRERAIIADDYAELALRDTRLQGAAASLRWSGSWHEARVAIDPASREDCPPSLLNAVDSALQRYRRIGHDLAVVPAQIVPLRLALHVCVLPHYNRAQIRSALLDSFSNRRRVDGSNGFFHPDNWRFGDDVALSRIVAQAMAIDGIETVYVTALQRLNAPDDRTALDTGRLILRPGEIAQLDNDPDFPENGQLVLDIGGGR